MKTTMTTLCGLMAGILFVEGAPIISTFDSDVEGWTNGGTEGAVISQVGSGGNPDGYLQIFSVQASTHLVAPTVFLGDLSAYDGGTFSWDGVAINEGSGGTPPGSYAYGEVTVTGTAGSATHPGIPSANRPTVAGGWTGFSHDFTATAFGKTEGEWDAILADVTSITLGGNAWKGTETLGYDNIALGDAGPDLTPPTIVPPTDPADDSTGVAVGTNFVATFSENIALTATGTITVTDGSETRVVNLDGSADDGDASVLNNVLTVTLDTDLTNLNSSYDVLISNDAIVDTAAAQNPFAGTVAGDWNFTTAAAPDLTSPTIVPPTDPADDSTGVAVGTNFVATFSENIALTATGTITVTDGSETRVVNLDGSADDGDASVLNNVLTVTLDTDLTNLNSSYDVLISNDAIVDTAAAQNPFAGTVVGDWNFTTAGQAATIISTFDSNLESWTAVLETATLSQVGSGGHPDGYLELEDVGATTTLIAPTVFLGDLSAYDGGTFSWDGKAFDEGTGGTPPGSYAYGVVTVTGTAGSATHPGIPSASRPTVAGGWTGFSHDFTAADFGKTEGEWDAILANVTSITLGGNAWKGFETLGYDNIALATISGPGGNDFSDWIAGYSVGGQTGIGDDPDLDGVDSGVENFFGTAPDEFSAGLLAGTASGGSFTFTHPLNATPADDLTATYRWSTDLQDFYDDGDSNGAGTTTVDFAQGTPSGGMVTVTATITGTEIPAKLFVDVEVMQP